MFVSGRLELLHIRVFSAKRLEQTVNKSPAPGPGGPGGPGPGSETHVEIDTSKTFQNAFRIWDVLLANIRNRHFKQLSRCLSGCLVLSRRAPQMESEREGDATQRTKKGPTLIND